MCRFHYLLVLALVCPMICNATQYKGIERPKCEERLKLPYRPHSYQRHRIADIREEMKSLHNGFDLDAYIVPAWDEHLNDVVDEHDKRTQFISGFTGKFAHAVITLNSVALWTDEKSHIQANSEINCDWKIFALDSEPSVTSYLLSVLPTSSKVGVDPRYIPHRVFIEWEDQLRVKHIRLDRIHRNLIDTVWANQPAPSSGIIQVHPVKYAGEKWERKLQKLRDHLKMDNCDAIIITSLTEIAYLLNLRGDDIAYTPVFKAYLVVSQTTAVLYVDQSKTDLGIQLHFNVGYCDKECVKIKNYDEIWKDLRRCSQRWQKIFVPDQCVFDLGVNEAIYSTLYQVAILEKPSPVIFMRAQKNTIEREGMRRAHILDGAAMCDALALMERRFQNAEAVSEVSAANDFNRARYAIKTNRGLSLKTTVAFGPHSSIPHFETFNETDLYINNKEPVIFDSGGQYVEGTTIVSRTVHFGEPTFEQRQMYTNVLRAIIRISTLTFPENILAGEVDILARSSVWDSHNDYPQITGHGIGSFLSVQESPIKISNADAKKYAFKEGYFFSNQPGMYNRGLFGIRLGNVIEVYDTGERHPSGARFLGFRDVSLVPFDTKFIDGGLLSLQEKKWLNEYNARIRKLVGAELKNQFNMQTFHWMMNATMHVREYFPESEYRKRNNHGNSMQLLSWLCILAVITSVLV